MHKMLFAALAALPLSGAAAQTGTAPTLTLYEYPAYLGRSVTVTTATPDLATLTFARRARSARVAGGAWQVCPDTAYRGTCRTLSANAALLSASAIVSARPAAEATATPATTTTATTSTTATAAATVDLDALDVDAGVEGQDVAFFARPSLDGMQVSAGSNDLNSGTAFCKLAGFTSASHAGRARVQASNLLDVAARTRVRAFALRDVLCRR